MPRIRSYKAEFFDDSKVLECSLPARLLFLGLLPHCDDRGRMQYSLDNLKGRFFSSRLDSEIGRGEIEAFLAELEAVGLIETYSVKPPGSRENMRAQRWLRIVQFARHQVINKPSHCNSPYSPLELESRDLLLHICACDPKRTHHPECEELREQAAVSMRNGRPTLAMFLRELTDESVNGTGLVREYGTSTGQVTDLYRGIGVERSKSKPSRGESEFEPQAFDYSESRQRPPDPHQQASEERRTQRREADEIAMRMLGILQVDANPKNLHLLAKAIEIRARSRATSIELAGQGILASAALMATESPPDSWEQWLEDARYLYVPQGDPRLKDIHIEARPVCGGGRCSDGWEMFKRGDQLASRRCPDCVKLWGES